MIREEEYNKEYEWRMKRCGKITSSSVGKLMMSGRRDMTPKELEEAKLKGIKRKTIDIEFGDTAITYLYSLSRERRLNKPCRHVTTKDMEWGKEHEATAIKCFNENYFHNFRSCTNDFDDIIFKDNIIDGYGDSPDGYEFDKDNFLTAIAEVKCFPSESKIEMLRDATKEEAIQEYYWQLISHFLSHPGVEELYYIVYDAQSEDDEFDVVDPMDSSRLLYWVLNRKDYEDDINKLEKKVRKAAEYLSLNQSDPVKYKIKYINDYFYKL